MHVYGLGGRGAAKPPKDEFDVIKVHVEAKR